MNAVDALEAAEAIGISVGIDGTDLIIEADCAPPKDLLDALRRDKREILNLLSASAIGGELTTNKNSKPLDLHGLSIDEVQEAAGEDWPIVKSDPAILGALVHAVVTGRQRERGECPPHYTAICECAGCGPMHLWPGSPARVLGCPWCLNRAEDRPIPRPVAVTCNNCRHFRRIDHPHLGHCAKGEPEAIAGLWDTDRRGCDRWLPSEQKPGVQSYGQ